jgi:uncharacterized protein YkuJ
MIRFRRSIEHDGEKICSFFHIWKKIAFELNLFYKPEDWFYLERIGRRGQ